MDADQIRLLKQGNPKAQKECFEEHAGRLLSVARRYAPKHWDPLDIVQDSFMRIFNKIHLFDENKGSFNAWTAKIVINISLDQLKKSMKIVDGGQLVLDEPIDSFNVLDKLTIDEIMAAIDKLPDLHKQVFSLFEIEGYNHREIAELLKIKEVTSRSNLFRAKQKLEELITGNKKAKGWILI